MDFPVVLTVYAKRSMLPPLIGAFTDADDVAARHGR